MSLTLAGIELPADLHWVDELDAWRVGQTVTTSLNGAQIIQEGELLAGRPITLESQWNGNTHAWVTRSLVDSLLALASIAGGAPMSLVVPLHGGGTQTYSVRWRRTDGPPIEAKPIAFQAPVAPGDYYSLTLRLLQV